mmetsp:Transcript_15539/g.26265  ORF Transcript_15539/g.26265 Transcript_15539/m.26265 type:complete len:110 (+) Transcript_15539:126-455(+)
MFIGDKSSEKEEGRQRRAQSKLKESLSDSKRADKSEMGEEMESYLMTEEGKSHKYEPDDYAETNNEEDEDDEDQNEEELEKLRPQVILDQSAQEDREDDPSFFEEEEGS